MIDPTAQGTLQAIHTELAANSRVSGLLSEYLYDERDPETQDLFDREIFAGTRLGFNDVAGTAVLAGAVRSLDETTVAYLLEAERRFGSSLKVSAQVRALSNVPDSAPEQSFSSVLEQEDTFSLIMEAYF